MNPTTTYFERLGGEKALRAIIASFTETVFDDVMIGFLFAGKNQARITEMEYQHAASFLGAPVAYSGRPIRAVHRKLPILGGHFARRRKILENTLLAFEVDADIREGWLSHVNSLREEVLGPDQTTDDCDHEAAMKWNEGS